MGPVDFYGKVGCKVEGVFGFWSDGTRFDIWVGGKWSWVVERQGRCMGPIGRGANAGRGARRAFEIATTAESVRWS